MSYFSHNPEAYDAILDRAIATWLEVDAEDVEWAHNESYDDWLDYMRLLPPHFESLEVSDYFGDLADQAVAAAEADRGW